MMGSSEVLPGVASPDTETWIERKNRSSKSSAGGRGEVSRDFLCSELNRETDDSGLQAFL